MAGFSSAPDMGDFLVLIKATKRSREAKGRLQLCMRCFPVPCLVQDQVHRARVLPSSLDAFLSSQDEMRHLPTQQPQTFILSQPRKCKSTNMAASKIQLQCTLYNVQLSFPKIDRGGTCPTATSTATKPMKALPQLISIIPNQQPKQPSAINRHMQSLSHSSRCPSQSRGNRKETKMGTK
jgi:hypothetical protein